MLELKTADGVDVHIKARSILYLCHLTDKGIEVMESRQYGTVMQGLDAYSNIPNPESQLITGKDYDDLIKNMHTLHSMMKRESWLEMLRESI